RGAGGRLQIAIPEVELRCGVRGAEAARGARARKGRSRARPAPGLLPRPGFRRFDHSLPFVEMPANVRAVRGCAFWIAGLWLAGVVAVSGCSDSSQPLGPSDATHARDSVTSR